MSQTGIRVCHAGSKRRNFRLGVGERHLDVLIDLVRHDGRGTRTHRRGGLSGSNRLALGFDGCLELLHHATLVDDVRMRIGVPQCQLVQQLASCIGAPLQVGSSARSVGDHGARLSRHERLLFLRQLTTQRLAAVLELTQFKACGIGFLLRCRGLSHIVGGQVRHERQVANLELLERVFGFYQTLLITRDLLIDEPARLLGIAAFVTQIRLHEDRQQ